jgi:uncharacterized protein with HEPN domain
MPPEVVKYLRDARISCGFVQSFTQNKTFDEYLADRQLQAAVEREFTIAGEPIVQAYKLDSSLDQSMDALRQIIGFRNILVHGYAVVSHKTVWGIIENDLPLLIQQLEGLLALDSSP